MIETIQVSCSDTNRAIGLWNILKTYGVFPIKSDSEKAAQLLILEGDIPKGVDLVKEVCNLGGNAIWIYPNHKAANAFNLDVLHAHEEGILKPPKKFWFMKGSPKAISRFGARRIGAGLVFSGNGTRPLLINTRGEYEAVAQHFSKGTIYWVGSNVADEIIRFRQGDPSLPRPDIEYQLHKICERPQYRFECILERERAHLPEADLWGWWFAQCVWKLAGRPPRFWPLPAAERSVVLFTGDEDECDPELVERQVALFGEQNIPFTLFATMRSQLDEAAIKRFSAERVKYELHPVVDSDPDNYEPIFAQQMQWFEKRFGTSARAVRNHMHLHKGYIDYSEVWERYGIVMDFNYPGSDGTVLNGSLLPMQYRSVDGRWLTTYAQITLFADSLFAKLTASEARARVKKTFAIMNDGLPGAVVFNFHPFNIEISAPFLQSIMKWILQKACSSLDVSAWMHFVLARKHLRLVHLGYYENGSRYRLVLKRPAVGLTLWLDRKQRCSKPFRPAVQSCVDGGTLWSTASLDRGEYEVVITNG